MAIYGVYWIRNDHRIYDNRVLKEFCESCQSGYAFYTASPSLFRAEKSRRTFYDASLLEYADQLADNHLSVNLSNLTPVETLDRLFLQKKFDHLYYSREVTTEETDAEAAVNSWAQKNGVKVYSFFQDTLLDREHLSFGIEDLPQIFTDFRKKVEKNLSISKPLNPPSTWPRPFLKATPSPKTQHSSWLIPETPGEKAARKRLSDYFWTLDGARTYKETRNGLLNWNDSTKFSLWLSSGSLSARSIFFELQKYEEAVVKNDSTYWIFFELLWRDYFKFYAQKRKNLLFPKTTDAPSSEKDLMLFKNWCFGETEDDFINANMRELVQTGWMSNRGRQNVASFLAKKLNLPWWWGADWFEKQLLDYDAALNWGNWRYFSGTGTDPRDRMFNTSTQAERYDTNGAYRQKWLGYKQN